MTVLITGAAGFIGYHLSKRLLEESLPVVGFDNLNSYYDPNLKKARLTNLNHIAKTTGTPFEFVKGDLVDQKEIKNIFKEYLPKKVVNLAAQAGVRYSIENPSEYIQSNIVGFSNILEACREYKVEHLIYASSSSVYGGNISLPYSEKDSVDHPISLYAASKKSNELMAHTYSHLFKIPTTGLRFFTVYGPWGRPDMALFIFTKSILNNEPINVFNKGNMVRDFTYIDDIVESLKRILEKPAIPDKNFDKNNPNPSTSWAPYKIFNIGNSTPTPVIDYINAIEDELNLKAKKLLVPIQMGDVPATESDSSELEEWINFKPNTSIKSGVRNFIKWYKEFYGC
tara:strand:- start:3605 stop:4627 length:1023 start_codon:yes stop_codon:yes gene_type:complete